MEQTATTSQLVYVVDDDVAIAQLVTDSLLARGYRVKQFSGGNEALTSLQSDRPDLIVLDLLMPNSDGLEMTKTIRQHSQVPILVLGMRDGTAATIAALDLGADDYLIKPFRVDDLIARVRVVLRRSPPSDVSDPLPEYSYRSGELLIDLEGMRVTSHHHPVQLTRQEWATLRVLVKYAGRIVSSRQLIQEAWGAEYGDAWDSVRAYITRLRRKLEPEPRMPRYILLERDLGYRLVDGE